MNEVKTGFVPDSPDERDFVFGAEVSLAKRFAGRTILNEAGDWINYLPPTEHQAPDYETNACVSFGTLNAIEILRQLRDDIDENLSDRYVARMSGTDPLRGNSPRNVANAVKKWWSLKESEYPRPATLEEFYKNIPRRLIQLAIGRGAYYDFGYEKVNKSDIKEALRYSPLGISVPAWFKGEDGLYYRPEGQRDTHWCTLVAMQPNGNYIVFDSYYPFLKELRADIDPEIIYSYYLDKQVINESWWTKFLDWLQLSLGRLGV